MDSDFTPNRRHVLAAGAAAIALAMLPRTAAAQTRPPRDRSVTSLNGAWDFQPTIGLPTTPPADGTWAAIPVPAEWNMTAGTFSTSWDAYDLFDTPSTWDSVDVAWYRRPVTVPTAYRGNRIVLRFEAVNFEATVYWNGTKVGQHTGGLVPFEVDVTDHVTWDAANTVHVLVRSGTAAARQADGWHYPNGSWWGQTCWGIWQDVWLMARPAVHVRDSFVTTSVANKRITVTTTLANDGTTVVTVPVSHVIADGPHGSAQVAVPAGGTATVTFDQPWANPRLWSPADPHLYQLTVTAAADTSTVRFGFREVSVRGTDILLNGVPVKLRGDSWHYMGSVQNSRAYATAWFTMVKALGVNYVRPHAMPYPPVYYDVADELGLLIVAESGIYGSSGNYAVAADDFWANCADHLTARVLRDRNHPSVIAWSAENEVLAAFGKSWAPQVAALKPVVTALDPTRPVYFEGDGDSATAGDFEATHYPLEITTGGTAIPESAYALAPGQPRASFWDRQKPMVVGEFSSMYYAVPSQVSAVGGPATYASLDGLWSAHALIVGAQIEGLRYAGVTALSPWNTVWYGMRHLAFDPTKESLPLPETTGPQLKKVGRWAATLNPGFEHDLPAYDPNPIHASVVRTMPPTAALATDYRAHFFAGSTLTRTFAVYDEVPAQRTITVTWTLRVNGTRSGSKQITVPVNDKVDVKFDIPLPSVTAITAGTLIVQLSAAGKMVYESAAPLTVYPKPVGRPKAPPAAAVLETTTTTSTALAALGVTTRRIADLSTLPTGNEILVIGEGANINPTADQITALAGFVHGGGRVVVLAQGTLPQLLPWPMVLAASPQTIAHVSAPHHPVLTGIGAGDLRWWNTASELVVQSAMTKPRYGGLVSLADVGPALASSALAEAPYGAGSYLFCQFPVIAAAAEPMAAILLRNILDAPKTAPRLRFGVVTASGSPIEETLKASAADFVRTTDPSTSDVLLLDATATVNTAAVNSWVAAGGTLWINGLSPATYPSFKALLPNDVTLAPLDTAHQLGAVTTGKSAVADGLTNADLDWPGAPTALVTTTVTAAGGKSAVDSRGVDWTAFAKGSEQNKYQVAAESARGFQPASVLWEKPVGKGRIVIDQLHWSAAVPLPRNTAVASTIAAALGVGFTTGSGSGLIPTTGWHGFANPNNAGAGNGFDRDATTRWSSNAVQTPGMYYGVDLGATRTLTRIIWDSALSAGDLPPGLDIQTSADGTAYTTVLSIPDTSTMSTAGVLTITLASVRTRYLKMVDTGSKPGNYLSLHELYLFGE